MTRLPTTAIRPGIALPCFIRGTWQLHERAGRLDPITASADLRAGFDLGFTAIEASDSYDGVEDLLGHFRADLLNTRGRDSLDRLRIHTRVTQTGAAPLSADDIRARVQRSLQRLGQDRLDLVQLQWWNLAVPGWREAAQTLESMQAAGLIADIGLTNFPTAEMQTVLADGIQLFSNQVQISLLDPRAETSLIPVCRTKGLQVFGYGPLAGGFLSEAWHGEPDPGFEPTAAKPFGTVYRQLIARFGGWDWLQNLLGTLKACALHHDTDIASIALAWTLQQGGATALLVGMSSPARAAAYAKAARLDLSDADVTAIRSTLAKRGPVHEDVAVFERTQMQGVIAASYSS